MKKTNAKLTPLAGALAGGADTLDGGEGNDTLMGDANWDAGPGPVGETENERWVRVGLEGQYHGNDLINGGDGDDSPASEFKQLRSTWKTVEKSSSTATNGQSCKLTNKLPANDGEWRKLA